MRIELSANWHIEFICEHIPPDKMKSLLVAFNNVAGSVTSVQLKQPHVDAEPWDNLSP